jgi:membrane fusion protein, heavy metal efflux system
MRSPCQGILVLWLLLAGLTVTAVRAQDYAQESGEPHGEHEEGVLRLTAAERRAAGVSIGKVKKRIMADEITVPGEVALNIYRSAQVTPRIEAQVIARHARLGQMVKQGQPLVTLSSVEMAEAQGELIVADREWERVKALGSDLVSARRYVAAQVARQQAYARVLTFGMTPEEVNALLGQGDASKATGEFDLLAPRDGTVISDAFVMGEMVQPGRVLFEISDESIRWVEAHLSPEDAVQVTVGAPARVSPDGEHWFEGTVAQLHHRLEETTRTRAVRITVHNNPDTLHPGEFVTVALAMAASAPVIAVPDQAVVLMGDGPTVFKAEGDEFHPQQVQVGQTSNGWTEIRAGLREGETIAVDGLYFLKSLVLKSQIGEGHAH